MVSYIIKAQFRSGNCDYTEYTEQLNNAVEYFNKTLVERKKQSKLSIYEVTSNYFMLRLDSKSKLEAPTKALSKFSQSLANDSSIKQFIVNGNQILRCEASILERSTGKTKESELTDDTKMTDADMLNTIIKIVLNSDNCINENILQARKNSIESIKNILQKSLLY